MAEPVQRLQHLKANQLAQKTDAVLTPKTFSSVNISAITLGVTHGAGCSCNGCKPNQDKKDTTFSSISASTIVLPSAPDHVHGPNCGCTTQTQSKDTPQFSSINLTDIILLQTHGAGCACSGCKGQNQNKTESFSAVDTSSIILPSVHAAGCDCSGCKNHQDKKDQSGVSVNISIDVSQNQAWNSCSLSNNNSYFQPNTTVIQNPIFYMQNILFLRKEIDNSLAFTNSTRLSTASPLVPPPVIPGFAQPVHFQEVAISQKTETFEVKTTKSEPDRKIKKQYIVGRYTYQDILTIPWLRKKYGYLIGLVDTEENFSNVTTATIKPTKMKNTIFIKPIEVITKKTNLISSKLVKPVEKAKVNFDQKSKELKEKIVRKEKVARAKIENPKLQDKKYLLKEKIRKQHQQTVVINRIKPNKTLLVFPAFNSPKKKIKTTPLVVQKVLKNTPTKVARIIEKIKKGEKIRIKQFNRLTKDEIGKLKKLLKSKQIVKWLLLYSNKKKKNRLQLIKHLLGFLKNLLKNK